MRQFKAPNAQINTAVSTNLEKPLRVAFSKITHKQFNTQIREFLIPNNNIEFISKIVQWTLHHFLPFAGFFLRQFPLAILFCPLFSKFLKPPMHTCFLHNLLLSLR